MQRVINCDYTSAQHLAALLGRRCLKADLNQAFFMKSTDFIYFSSISASMEEKMVEFIFTQISQAKTVDTRPSQSNIEMETVDGIISPRSSSSVMNSKIEHIQVWPQFLIVRV